jgi:hypothetical protein
MTEGGLQCAELPSPRGEGQVAGEAEDGVAGQFDRFSGDERLADGLSSVDGEPARAVAVLGGGQPQRARDRVELAGAGSVTSLWRWAAVNGEWNHAGNCAASTAAGGVAAWALSTTTACTAQANTNVPRISATAIHTTRSRDTPSGENRGRRGQLGGVVRSIESFR